LISTHLAGIIPVANLKTDHDIPTPPYLLPVAPGFTCIQRAVHECALAGCNSIWIVANQDMAPIVRKVIGEWTYDPVHYNNRLAAKGNAVSHYRKEIPIYYTGIRDKDRDRRDSYGWSVLHGIHSVWWVTFKISKWTIPEKYFVSFPMGVYDYKTIRKNRRLISSRDKNFFSTFNGQTVKNNLPLSFTMRKDDFIFCRRNVNKLTTKEYLPPLEGEKYPSKKRPLADRWSARWFNFDTVFDKTEEENSLKKELDWFYDISSWDGYREYLGSEHTVDVPIKQLTKTHLHGRIFK
jgi:hypothetical protein